MPNLDAFQVRLLPNETVLWSGVPAQGLLFHLRDVFLIPFSLAWGGIAIFGATATTRGGAAMPALFGALFVLVALFIIFGRFLADAWLRSKIAYALTDRRALIVRTGAWPNFKAVSLSQMAEVTLDERSNGRGTIRFGSYSSIFGGYRGGVGYWVPSLDPTPQFLVINDVRRVFALIQERQHRQS